jgi:5-methylcytosine-specific restriction endonuclease McrA
MFNNLFQLFQNCSHTAKRLERKSPPKSEFKLEVPGIGPLFTVGQRVPDFIYHCPSCNRDLPVGENARWEAMFRSYAPQRSTPPPTNKRQVSGYSQQKRPSYQRQAIPAGLRYDILNRDKNRCVKCGATGKEAQLEVDHIHPVSRGGNNDPKNLQTLCKRCNLGKGARVI